MPVPIVYRKSGEGAIATYDFYDIANATGYIDFYGALYNNGSVTGTGVLTNANTYSDKIETNQTGTLAAAASFTQLFDIDFSTTINQRVVFDGVAYMNIPCFADTAPGQTIAVYCDCTIEKITSGATSTIATASGAILTSASGTEDHPYMFCIKLDVPQTVYKKDDTLNVNVKMYYTNSAPGGQVALGHDPKNRNGTNFLTEPTTMIFHMPVKIDL